MVSLSVDFQMISIGGCLVQLIFSGTITLGLAPMLFFSTKL